MPPLAESADGPPPAHIIFRQDRQRGVSIATWHGRMTDHILLEHYQRFYRSPDYDPAGRELVDLRALSANLVTTVGLKKLAALATRRRRHGLTAVIVASDLSFGLGRMYNVFGPDAANRVEIFRELGPALQWLGLSPDVPPDPAA